MGKVITLGLQKGGVSKSTSTGVLAYLLSQDGYKVLVVDMDSQGNVTEMLTRKHANYFKDKSILEAIVFRSAEDYIYPINDRLHIIPANNWLALLPRWLWTKEIEGQKYPYTGNVIEQLDLTLKPIRENYDFILIDTPPALSEQTTNSFVTSDYILIPYECSYFCYQAIPNFLESVELAKQVSKYDLKIIGIIRTLNDVTRNDAKLFNLKIQRDFPDLVFKTIITRTAYTGRVPYLGFEGSKELNKALVMYKEIYKELKVRLGLTEPKQEV